MLADKINETSVEQMVTSIMPCYHEIIIANLEDSINLILKKKTLHACPASIGLRWTYVGNDSIQHEKKMIIN